MRKGTTFCLAHIIMAFIIVFACSATSSAQGLDERFGENTQGPSEAIERAMDSVLELFKPVSGTVSVVENGFVKVSFKSTENIGKGMRFSVFRKGTPFYHPVTNETIGETEDFTGRIEVINDEPIDGLYHCVIVTGEVRAGDLTRITSSKIKLAFYQNKKSNWALSEAFYNSLKESGRFEILESYAPVFNPEDLSQIARGLNAEAVLMFSTPLKKDGRSINISMYWAEDAKLFGEIEEVPEKGGIAIPSENQFMFVESTDIQILGSYALSKGRLLAVGDVDQNGTQDYIVSSGSDIKVFNIINNELHELWHIKDSVKGKHLSLDVLDLNNNGIPEIFVTASVGDRVLSSILEYGSSGYRTVSKEMPYLFRVIDNKLLMQKFNRFKGLTGPVYEGEWREDKYQSKRAIDLPSDVNIYGFSYIDWQNNGQKQLVTFDDQGYLNLYDKSGQLIWQSSETYGDFDLSLRRNSDSMEGNQKEWVIRSNLMSVRTERGSEIVAIRKIPHVSTIPGIGSRGGEVYSLWWDGDSMDEKLILKEIPGAISDYWVQGSNIFIIARSGVFSVVRNVITGDFSLGSMLYYYNFGEK